MCSPARMGHASSSTPRVDSIRARLPPSPPDPSPPVMERLSSLDAIFLAFAPESPVIQALLRDPTVKLFNFSHAEAYTRRLPSLNHVVMPENPIKI